MIGILGYKLCIGYLGGMRISEVPGDRGRQLAGWSVVVCVLGEPRARVREPRSRWAYEQGLRWHTIQRERTMENGYMERFNERVRYESLNENWFSDLADAREKITQWRQDYNEKRPHGSLQCRT
ncbi:MAG TPA: transposase [Terriglobales bacterium]|nr:transposase [Terriglobales bacterium]